MTVASIEADPIVGLRLKFLTLNNSTLPLECMPYIYHLVQFKKDQAKIQVLLDFSNKINAMTSAYIAKLDPKI